MRVIAIYVLTALIGWFDALTAAPALAQEYPKSPVRLIVPFPAGGATDIITRLVGQQLQDIWSQPVLVDYKPGAGTLIGADTVAKSAPDGYTIGVVVPAFTINPGLRLSMPYDTLKDLTGVTMLTKFALAIVANPSVPFDDIKGLVEYAKRNPGKLFFASPGTGGTAHLTGELLKGLARINMVHVPYKGGSPAEMDVIGGRVPLMIDPLFAAMQFVRTGKMKVIAVSSARRVPGFDQYPAIAETYPGFDVNAYVGFVVPSPTPRRIVQKIQEDSVKALNAPKVRARVLELGNEVVGSTSEEFNAFIASDMKTWVKVIRDAGIPRE